MYSVKYDILSILQNIFCSCCCLYTWGCFNGDHKLITHYTTPLNGILGYLHTYGKSLSLSYRQIHYENTLEMNSFHSTLFYAVRERERIFKTHRHSHSHSHSHRIIKLNRAERKRDCAQKPWQWNNSILFCKMCSIEIIGMKSNHLTSARSSSQKRRI